MAFDVPALSRAIVAISAKLEAEHGLLTELDGKVGDGDLGITLLKAFRELDRIKPEFPADDLGQALAKGASGVAKVSSSSFGTLLATGMIAVAKEAKGKNELSWSEMSSLLDKVVQAMMARGKASLGDKTVLDALDAVARALEGVEDPSQQLESAKSAVQSALDSYRDKPNKIGRARIFAERTVGLDDPGMVAVKFMLEAL